MMREMFSILMTQILPYKRKNGSILALAAQTMIEPGGILYLRGVLPMNCIMVVSGFRLPPIVVK